jgi:hypothetical protein
MFSSQNMFPCHDQSNPVMEQVVLYEDELADNGVSLLTVKVVTIQSFNMMSNCYLHNIEMVKD